MRQAVKETGKGERTMKEKRWGYGLLSRCRGELMGLAMLWVMLFHAFAWRPKWQWLYDFKGIGFCGVDMFLLLSGMGLALSLCKREQSYEDYLKRRLVRVLPTYWLVTGAYGLALRLAKRTTLKTVAWTMSTLFYWCNKPNYFNWYVPALLGFYLIAPAAVALLRRVKFPQLVVGGSWALSFVLYQLTATAWGEVPGGSIARIPIFLTGCMLGVYLAREKQLTWKGTAVWCALPLLIPVVKWAQPYYLPNGLWFMLVCVPICLALAWLLEWLPKGGFRRALREIGGASLEIYLLNVVFVLERELLERVVPIGPNYLAFYGITIPLNILLGIGLHYALKKPLAWLKEALGSKG